MLRKRSKIDYSEDSTEPISSTSKWTKETSNSLKIKSINCSLDEIGTMSLTTEAEKLILPLWTDGDWLRSIDFDVLEISNKIKTLMVKIMYVYLAQSRMREMYVDGFMDSLLHLLEFDDYPCLMYPQYEYSADIGEESIVAKSDFSILTKNHKMLVVIEDKTMENAKYSNNWKEDQVLGELFVAVHDIAINESKYPIEVYAIRVVGTLFTFYKTLAEEDYIKETLKGYPTNHHMNVLRHPAVEDKVHLTAYDICNKDDRLHILSCMSYIKKNMF
jgi:hypothetical protein